MKKFKCVLIFIFGLMPLSWGQTTFQASELPADVVSGLQSVIDPILSQCCYDFTAKDYYSSSITQITERGEDQLEVKGNVSYHGNHCDYRINTTYTVVLNPKDGNVISRCIKTPTCFMGMSTGDVIDCNCTEYMTFEQKAAFASKTAPVVLQFLNSH